MERWSGQVAVVTGSSSGVGRALCVELVKNGLQVVALARRSEKLQDLEESLRGFPGKIKGIKCDVRNPTEIKAAFKWIAEHWGHVSILVNNAAYGPSCSLEDLDPETFRVMLETNILSITTCSKEMVSYFKKKNAKEGHILNICSMLGHNTCNIHGLGPYSATKHAVTSLSFSLKYEFESQRLPIKVSNISPGLIDTEFIMDRRELLNVKPYLQDTDVVQCIMFAISTPRNVNVIELMVEGLAM